MLQNIIIVFFSKEKQDFFSPGWGVGGLYHHTYRCTYKEMLVLFAARGKCSQEEQQCANLAIKMVITVRYPFMTW